MTIHPRIHRNPGKTATTHVKDTVGKRYRVHDGSAERATIVIDDVALDGLDYASARKAKEIAVARKYRKAAIVEMTAPSAFAGEGNPTAPRLDPQLERARQKAVAAARPAAAQAQRRHEAQQAADLVRELSDIPKTPIVGLDPLDGDDVDLADGELADLDVEDILSAGAKPQVSDAQRAKEQAEKDAQAAEIAGMELYAKENPGGQWGALDGKQQQAYRWRAINETPSSPQPPPPPQIT